MWWWVVDGDPRQSVTNLTKGGKKEEANLIAFASGSAFALINCLLTGWEIFGTRRMATIIISIIITGASRLFLVEPSFAIAIIALALFFSRVPQFSSLLPSVSQTRSPVKASGGNIHSLYHSSILTSSFSPLNDRLWHLLLEIDKSRLCSVLDFLVVFLFVPNFITLYRNLTIGLFVRNKGK